MILTSKNFGSQWSAFTTSQASDTKASYGKAGALADNPVDLTRQILKDTNSHQGEGLVANC